MKKIILCVLLMLTLVGCKNKEHFNGTISPGDDCWSVFEKYSEYKLSYVAEAIAAVDPSLDLKIEEVEPGELIGFECEVTDFKQAMVIYPNDISVSYICYVFEVEKDDILSLVELMELLEKNYESYWVNNAGEEIKINQMEQMPSNDKLLVVLSYQEY